MKSRTGIFRAVVFGLGFLILLLYPVIASNRYQVHIVNMALLYILISLGLNIAMGYCGQFNLAIGAFWGVGAYTAAVLNTRLGWPLWIDLPAAMIVSGLIGALVGLPSLKVRSHYLAIVTLGLGEVINIVLVNEDWLTNGPIGISGIAMPSFLGLALDGDERYYYVILAAVVIGYLIARQIVGNRIGRSFRAIRDDYVAAKAMGVNLGYYQILAFALSAVYAGAAGALFAHLNTYISPDIFEVKATLLVLTLTMVGGMGNLVGSLVGGLTLPILQEYLRAIGNWQLVAYGLAIVLVVLFLPGGLMELTQRLESSGIRWPWSRRPASEELRLEGPHVS